MIRKKHKLKHFITFVATYLLLYVVTQVFVRNDDDGSVEYNTKNTTVKSLYVVSDQWQFIGYPSRKFGIYSAYFDERAEIIDEFDCPIDYICIGTVRIIAILPANISHNFQCNLEYTDRTTRQESAKLYVTDVENLNKTHLVYAVVCPIKQFLHSHKFKFPYAVGLTYDGDESMWEPTTFTFIRYPEDFNSSNHLPVTQKSFAVCVPAFIHTFSSTIRLVEFIELYKILGINHFYFYKHTISQDVQKVLNYYENHDNITVLEWNTDYGTQEIHYEGISACFHDCYYRASFVGNFDYVILLDLDEILMPMMKNVTTIPELMRKLDRPDLSGFNFQNVFFGKDDNYEESGVLMKAKNRQLYSQTFLKRTKPYSHHNRAKSIAKGKDVIILENHFIKLSVKNKHEHNVMANEGLLFHYRDRPHSGKYELQEMAALKYGNELSANVDKICQKVFANGICTKYIF